MIIDKVCAFMAQTAHVATVGGLEDFFSTVLFGNPCEDKVL